METADELVAAAKANGKLAAKLQAENPPVPGVTVTPTAAPQGQAAPTPARGI